MVHLLQLVSQYGDKDHSLFRFPQFFHNIIFCFRILIRILHWLLVVLTVSKASLISDDLDSFKNYW